MNVVIIEDEAMSAEDLADQIVQADPTITIVAMLASVKETIAYLNLNPKIDLIFSDIQLGDGLSFEIFKKVPVSTPIIFCTAFDQYAIEAFKNNGIDYILKPFDNQSVLNALRRYHQLKQYFKPEKIDYEQLIKQLSGNTKNNINSVLIYQKDKVLPLKLNEVALFYIEHEITQVICLNRKSYTIPQNLDELENLTDGTFFRVNRQYLINRAVVKDAEAYFHRKYVVNLIVDFPEKIIVSKNRASAFFSWLIQR